MLQKQDKPDVMQGIGTGANSGNTTPEPNNGNTIVKVIVCLFVVGIILSIIF